MAEKLTPQQAQAVCDRGGKLLVSAAAGSGKTKVLVDRLLRYLTDPVDPANIDDFLIITYTKAAAAELRGKIAAKLSERIAEDPENKHLQHQVQRLYLAKISTVHAFCGDILREYAYRLDLPGDFRVADENECRELRETAVTEILEEAYEHAEENLDFCAFVDTQGLGRDDRLVPQIVLRVYDSAQCHGDPDAWLDSCIRQADIARLDDVGQTVWGKYLMENLFSWLDLQIAAMQNCAVRAADCPEFAKPAGLLQDTVYQLQKLRDSKTWDEVIVNGQISYGVLRFPSKNPDPELTDRIKAVRDSCKKGLEKRLRSFSDPTAQSFEDLSQSAAAIRGMISLVRSFAADYDRMKRSRHILDFADLEHKALDLLLGKARSGPTQAAREIGNRFREVLVDEYQDSNGVQDAIFTALTQERQNCFMVGDVKQSIYQFRLADPGIFLKKYKEYIPAGEAKEKQGRKVLLSSNFRSGGAVLEAVNDVFRTCMSPEVGGLHYGEGEMLREGIPHVPLGEPEVELCVLESTEDANREEAAFAAEKIRQLLDGTHMVRDGETLRPIVPDDIVILLRSPGSASRAFQNALMERGIRYCSGGGENLLETEEVSTLRSILQTVANPRQDIPLLAALASPVFGFTADDLAEIRKDNRKCSVYEGLLQSDMQKAQDFIRLLKILREDSRMKTLPELLERIFLLTGMERIYAAMQGGEGRAENLREFYQMTVDFSGIGQRDLGQFLDHLTAMEEKGLNRAGEQSSPGCVTIMSIHKSKGLEFPVVLLCNLSREFNRESQKAQVLCDKDLGLGLSAVDEKNRIRYPTVAKRAISAKIGAESLSEELRVLYVAMTRARDRLIMTYCAKNPEKDLKDIALRLDLGGSSLLVQDVVCPGEWILLEAMQRTEAGELFALSDRPDETHGSQFPWKISLIAEQPEAAPAVAVQEELPVMPAGTERRLEEALQFRYAHMAATRTASKQTATSRKGREKDEEVSENAPKSPFAARKWRKPSFKGASVQGTTYGNAIHAAMQYIRYEQCTSLQGIREETERMVREKFLTQEQGKLVNCEKIYDFFRSELGQMLLSHRDSILREFKFSILDDGTHYGEGLEGEQVLLQGVVDCALMEPEEITVIDFKTDFVTEQTLPVLLERYRQQIETYAEALSRVYDRPVKKRYLYFFHLNRAVQI